MSISRWPFIDLDRFLDEAIRVQNASTSPFEDQQNPRLLKPRCVSRRFLPSLHTSAYRQRALFRMDVHEDPEKNLVTATFELPGLSKDKISIDVHNGNLTVSGNVSESSEREEHPYVIRERRSGRFSRTIKLPEGTDVGFLTSFHFEVDTDEWFQPKEVKALMEHGLLTVTFPKSSPGMEPQRIAIN